MLTDISDRIEEAFVLSKEPGEWNDVCACVLWASFTSVNAVDDQYLYSRRIKSYSIEHALLF